MSNNLIFSMQTLTTLNGGTLKGLEPIDGVYKNIPLAVMGMESRNNAAYTPGPFANAMTNPGGRFYKSLQEGNLEGEWGHPILDGMPKQGQLSRTLKIDRKNVSHCFDKIWTKQDDQGHIVVYGDVICCGPYGEYLDANFRNPRRNVAFSLRSVSGKPKRLPNGKLTKDIVALTTFDAVDCPGFEQASARHAIATESFDLRDSELGEIGIEEVVQSNDFVEFLGYEDITSNQILDMLESDKVVINTTKRVEGIFCPDTKSIITPNGTVSAFHALRI